MKTLPICVRHGGRTFAGNCYSIENAIDPISRKMEPNRKVNYKTMGDQVLELHVFEPKGFQADERRPVFLTFHGGGWSSREPRYFYPFAKHFADLGMIGISAQYRLFNRKTGITVFDCVRDARSVVRYLREHASDLGIDPNRIVVSGGSAGGHLAAATALFDGIDEEGEEASVSCRPDVLVLYYPVIDTSKNGYGSNKIGEHWRALSPLEHVKSGLPPTLLLHGTADNVTPFAGAAQFKERMQASGNQCQFIPFKGGGHAYFIYDLDLFAEAMSQTEQFLREQGILDDLPEIGKASPAP